VEEEGRGEPSLPWARGREIAKEGREEKEGIFYWGNSGDEKKKGRLKKEECPCLPH